MREEGIIATSSEIFIEITFLRNLTTFGKRQLLESNRYRFQAVHGEFG